MTRTAYPLAFVLDGRERHLLWIEDPDGYANDTVHARDSVVTAVDGRDALNAMARAEGYELADADDSPIDLDAVARWTEAGDGLVPAPSVTLNAWNAIGDIARSVGKPFDDRSAELDAIYDKVFAANNLPAMTPAGEHYVPRWSPHELQLLRSLLAHGLQLVREALPD
jgi:hypothetical protein